MAQGSTARRDELLAIQEERQKLWAQEKLFEVDAPAEGKSSFESGFWLFIARQILWQVFLWVPEQDCMCELDLAANRKFIVGKVADKHMLISITKIRARVN